MGTHQRNRLRASAILIVVAQSVCVATAHEPSEPAQQQRAEHLARMKRVAASIRLEAIAGEAKSEVALAPQPLLLYADSTRMQQESSLWIWTAGQRPAAILAVEYYPTRPDGPNWLYEIVSLSPERIAARLENEFAWTAKEPGLQRRVLDRADPPADSRARRLTQMKNLRRRFTAHETTPVEGRIELRPLNSPLHRYADPENGVIDGAIFAFTNGTNPEVLLTLEAHSKDGSFTWQYSLAQMTGAVVFAEFDDQPIWTRDEADPPAIRDSYVNGWIPVAAE
jgi:hypothetical protein